MNKPVALTLAVLAPIAAVAVGVVTAGASATTAIPQCFSAQLRPSFGGQQGAAGTLSDTWRLTNMGGRCRLSGFPAVHTYRADGRPLPTSVSPIGSAGTVTLAPGQHASFDLRYRNPAIQGCTAQPAQQMTIRVPGATLPVIVNRASRACGGQLSETALRLGG